MPKIRINIDGNEYVGQKGQTILQVAQENNIEIPTLCYDKRIEIYGGCGLCVVELEGSPKLFRACATEIAPNMIVNTISKRILESRKTTLELLLTDHTGDCRAPCVLACPALTDCQGYVGLIANGEFKEALKLIKEQLPLPASIGRVCPHPCEQECRRQLKDDPISIAWQKRFVADVDLSDPYIPEIEAKTGKKVAIIGGGPGGLTVAYYLAQKGHSVEIFDMMPEMGGMLKYGIPEYRLPKEILNKEIETISKMGVVLNNNIKIGKDITLEYLRKKNDALYLSPGCWNSINLNCPGEDLQNVYGGINFLADVVQNKSTMIGKSVAVIGGGNTAMDACRTAVRLGAEKVYVLYRRTREEMPAEEVEITECEEEGVIFKFLVSPLEILGENGTASNIKLQKMKLGEPDQSGRRRPIPIEGDEEILRIDSVIVAIGQYVNLDGFEGLELTKRKTISSDLKTFSTNIPGVFAGGDAINNNNKIAIQAIGDGKKASMVMQGYLLGKEVPYCAPYLVTRTDVNEDEFTSRPKANRPHMAHLSPDERKRNFREIVKGFTPEQAIEDAKRCLECGCGDYYECKLIKYSKFADVQPERFEGVKHCRKKTDDHPFIVRNSDKCILCGLCVRVCNDVMGITALGLVDRGFETIVVPDMGLPLKDTDCISCGQCISVCPTGALQEKSQMDKAVPLETKTTNSICPYCSVGCHIDIESRGNMIVKVIPEENSPVDDGLLCVKGRFGYDFLQRKNRITEPMIRIDGKLTPVSWNEAILFAAKKLEGSSFQYGPNSVAVSISDQWTTEEIYLANKFGSEVLKTDLVTNFNSSAEGIKSVLSFDASTNTLKELENTDLIVLIGSYTMRDHMVAALKIKTAVQNGAKLVTINPEKTKLDEYAHLSIIPENSINLLKEIAKEVLNNTCKPEDVNGLSELKKSLEQVIPGETAKEVTTLLMNAKNVMFVFDQQQVSQNAAKMIANIAVISGCYGRRPRNGIIQLKPQNNTQSIPLVGIKTQGNAIAKKIDNGDVKAMVVFGEDINKLKIDNLSCLIVMDSHMTKTAQAADVVLPSASFAESAGTYISTDRRIQHISKAVDPKDGIRENWEIIKSLSNVLGAEYTFNTSKEIFNEIVETVPGFLMQTPLKDVIWPMNENPVLYSDKSCRSKISLITVEDSLLFEKRESTNYSVNCFNKFLQEEGLERY